MKQFLLWFRIIRPQTLFASLCPVVVGLMVSPNPYQAPVGILTMVCALSLQVLSNLINDYYDFQKGADQAGRAGYKRALAEGDVSLQQIRLAILLTLCLALTTGVWLVYIGGWAILGIGLTALLFAWLYTATDHSLSYLGIADIFVYLYFGVLATMGTCYLQGSAFFYSRAFFAGSVCGLISMCVLMINNLRDAADDRAAGKRTFVVRFGKRAGEWAMLVLILLTPVFAYCALGVSWAMLILLPLLCVWIGVLRAKGKQYNACLLAMGICNVFYVLFVFLSI